MTDQQLTAWLAECERIRTENRDRMIPTQIAILDAIPSDADDHYRAWMADEPQRMHDRCV